MTLQFSDVERRATMGHRIPLGQRQEIIDAFHRLSYDEARRGLTWHATYMYLDGQAYRCYKWPCDLWLYLELITELRPATIIETGTAEGGSALFFARVLDWLDRGIVATIDLVPVKSTYPPHKRIRYLGGADSAAVKLEPTLKAPVMVVLDSDHSAEHVKRELDAYAPRVSVGSYLVVEDSNLDGVPVEVETGPGPSAALAEWLPDHPEFKVDLARAERYLFSYHTWLRRIE